MRCWCPNKRMWSAPLLLAMYNCRKVAAGVVSPRDVGGDSGQTRPFIGHEGPRTSVLYRWKEWGEERHRNIRNYFMLNGLRNLKKQSAGINRTGAIPWRPSRRVVHVAATRAAGHPF